MKETLLCSLRFLWPTCLPAVQHRDVIRVYAMGWIDSLSLNGNKEAVIASLEEAKAIADPNWWPDISWQWW